MSKENLNDYVNECFLIAESKGWWEQYYQDSGSNYGVERIIKLSADEILAKLMLIVSELSEAMEVVRNEKFNPTEITCMGDNLDEGGKPEGFSIELTDAVIRIFDLMGALGIDAEACYNLKTTYNKTRTQRHGGKRA